MPRSATDLARSILAAGAQAARPLLREAGFSDPDAANLALDRLSGPAEDLTPLPVCLLAAAIDSGWPDRALHHLERFVERTGARSSLYARLERAPPVRDGLARLLAHSGFLTDILVRNPEHLYWLFEATPHLTQPLGRPALQEQLQQTVEGAGDDLADALRRFQRRELLRIGTAEILGCKEVVQVGRELADLADVLVQGALDGATSQAQQRRGRPCNERGRPALFAAVGLGKYGGRELNFSSDIDLLFVYDEDGCVRRPDGQAGVDNAVYFDRLAEGLIQLLTEVTAEGFLYRVDMRLRPEGERGPLTRSLRSYWIYYETRGELWERQMLIKARRAAGSMRLGQRFREMLQPFVFPSHFAVSPGEEIRRIKERIEAEIRDRPGGANNIKLQAGGIRDIEFAVQCLQLLSGRAAVRTRVPGTLEAIARLRQAEALTEDEAQSLSAAYGFLRRLENLLQIESGRPSYAVPDDDSPHGRALARLLGVDGVRLSVAVGRHLAAVRQVYESVLHEVDGGARGRRPGPAPGDTRWLLEADPGSAGAAGLLGAMGFREAEAAHRVLLQLAAHPMLTAAGRQHLEALLDPLLAGLAAAPDADAGLLRFARLVDAYGAPGAFYSMAAGYPRFLRMLVTICGTSGLLAGLLHREPGLLDALVGADPGGDRPRLDPPARGDPAALRRYRDLALLRIGVDDLLGLASSEETFHRISDLADEVVAAVVDSVLGRLARRRGRPRTGRARPARFACFAGGKAGGRELDFASDLDLFFLYEGEGHTGRGIGNQEFFTEAARQVIAALGDGLFAVDARLRPEGHNAPVVISLDGYRRYLRTRGSTWERLALSRARWLAGDEDLGRRARSTIGRFVYGAGLDAATIDEVVAMRRRMEPVPARGTASEIDIKRGAGGIVDAEFIAQILALRHGAARPDLRHTSTRVVLERMVEAGALSRAEGRDLLLAYERLRQVQKALRLISQRPGHTLPPAGTELEVLARATSAASGAALVDEVAALTERTRARFDAVVAHLRAGASAAPRPRGSR